MPKNRKVPSYRRHKPSGRAVLTLGGRDFYRGLYWPAPQNLIQVL